MGPRPPPLPPHQQCNIEEKQELILKMTNDQEEVDQHVDVEETRDAGIFGEVVVKDLKWIVTVILVLDLINQVKTEMDLKMPKKSRNCICTLFVLR